MLFSNLKFNNGYLCAYVSLVLFFLLTSCQSPNTYEDYFEACLENVETTTFTVDGTGETGVAYSGFDVGCLRGAPLPNFEVVDIDGNTVGAAGLKGRVTVINFWFIKCAPCIEEIPHLNKLVYKYGKEEVNFVAFSLDDGADLKEFHASSLFHFLHVPDAESIIEDRFKAIWGYPSTIVVDKTGHIVEVFRGAKLATDPTVPVASAVDTLLEELLMDDG